MTEARETLLNRLISIHAAREGGDLVSVAVSVPVFRFQSTPPVKAATMMSLHVAKTNDISIHAAREGGDALRRVRGSQNSQISIHAAREGGDSGNV